MMKLMTLKQYMKMSKPALIRKITKTLRAMPKKRLAVLCYNITKSKLPRLKVKYRSKLSKKKREELDYLEERIKTNPYDTGLLAEFRRKNPAYARRAKALHGKLSKRKFSRKQLAAQRLFAKRARAGTLRKRRRR